METQIFCIQKIVYIYTEHVLSRTKTKNMGYKHIKKALQTCGYHDSAFVMARNMENTP